MSAESYLSRLRKQYADTKCYEDNKAAIEALWAKVRAEPPKAPPAPNP